MGSIKFRRCPKAMPIRFKMKRIRKYTVAVGPLEYY